MQSRPSAKNACPDDRYFCSMNTGHHRGTAVKG
jgi:hypothetical protein